MAVPDRLFVAIAVGKPEGGLVDLPGAIHAADQMAKWATNHGYVALAIHDGDGQAVTAELLKEKITQAIRDTRNASGGPVQRLVIFFAGHGAVSPVGQCWMLTRWQKNPNEAINVSALQRMLEFYGPVQVSVIGDACQEFSDKFKDVLGSAILERPDEAEQFYELDQFFAVGTGKQAFMIPAQGNEPAYCLFSRVLLDALDCKEAGAFDQVGDEHRVTSQSLAKYLRDAVPKAAGRHGVRMTPKSAPGFYTDTVYVGLRSPLVPPSPPPPPPVPSPAPAGGERLDTIHVEVLDAALAARHNQHAFFKRRLEAAEVPDKFETACGIGVSGAEVADVSASFGKATRVEKVPNWYRLDLKGAPDPMAWTDTLVTLTNGQVYSVCAIQDFVAALTVIDADTVSVFHRPSGQGGYGDFQVIELLARAHAGLLDESEIVNTAAELRADKHRYITLGCVAAQFYDAIRDVNSLRSMAAFYARRHQPVPLDIVLLGGGTLSDHGGRLYASIPAVPERRPRSHQEERRQFTFEATPAVERHPVAGRIPWMRNAWSAVATAAGDKSLETWRGQALAATRFLSTGDFTNVGPEGRQALAELAGIAVTEEAPTPVAQSHSAAG